MTADPAMTEYDAEIELQCLEGEIGMLRASLSAENPSLREDLARLEARRSELKAILDAYAAERARQSERDRAARLRAHVVAYNELVRKLNAEIVEIRANLPGASAVPAREAMKELRFLSEVDLPESH